MTFRGRGYRYEYVLRSGRMIEFPHWLHFVWRRLDRSRRRVVIREHR